MTCVFTRWHFPGASEFVHSSSLCAGLMCVSVSGFHHWREAWCRTQPCCLATRWTALAGASSCTTWLRRQRRMSCGSCSGHSEPCRASRSSVTSRRRNAVDLDLLRWRTMRKLWWPSRAWTDTTWATAYYKSRSKQPTASRRQRPATRNASSQALGIY